jgi:hypothetical protein
MEHMEHMEHEGLCQPKSWCSYLGNGSRTYTWNLLFHPFHVFQKGRGRIGDVGHEEPPLGNPEAGSSAATTGGEPLDAQGLHSEAPNVILRPRARLERLDLSSSCRS